jgi:two-component system nitrate/nitrite response regulator NarL
MGRSWTLSAGEREADRVDLLVGGTFSIQDEMAMSGPLTGLSSGAAPMRGVVPRIRVVVADDHPVYREGIVRAVKERPELELVGEVATGREALEVIAELLPDVAILDMRMPGLDGRRLLDAIRREPIPTRVLFVSAYVDSEIVFAAIGGGAHGYISKDATRRQICDAVSAIARGETVLAPEVHTGLARAIQLRSVDDRPVLTAREREVLMLIAEGLSAPEIGRRLYLSPATVKTHLQHLYGKLGVSDRAAAVAAAMRRGLLE